MSTSTIDVASRELWESAKDLYLKSLRSEEERSQTLRYFSMITSVSAEGNTFRILTSNSFAADLLRNDYAEKLKSCLDVVDGKKERELIFTFDENAKPTIVVPVAEEPLPAAPPSSYAPHRVSTFISTMPLNKDYTFEEFVEGQSNSWALAAAKGVVEHPGKIGYNPLFIHGGTGLGKTHLMQAIGTELRKRNPMLAVCYLTAETFLNEYVNALQNGVINSFRDRYRNIDVLLVDDVQFLQKGKQFQDEFFNTFNALTGAQKQIVMTSDVAPKNLPALESRLLSRFEGGLVQEIETPKYETRLAILKKKAEGMEPPIPESCITFIADNIKSHVRAMEGALAKVKVSLSINPSTTLTNEMLERLLKDFIDKEHTLRRLSVKEIQEAVANKYSVTVDHILASDRTASIVTPRQLAMYIARKYTPKSLEEIAEVFKRSHATILHGVKSISSRLDVEEDLRQTLEEIISEFGLKASDKQE